MTESDRPAAGIMRHYSRLTDVAVELVKQLATLDDHMRDDGLVSDAARTTERVQTLALRLAGQAEWLRAQLEPQE